MFDKIMRLLNFLMEFVFGVFSRLTKFVFILIFGLAVLFGASVTLTAYLANR